MFHLLKIEWLKVKNYRTFWILSGLFLISLFGINYIAWYVQNHVSSQIGQGANGNAMAAAIMGTPPFQFPDVWQTVAWMSGFLLFIPGLLMIISITNEFSYKTHRQNIIDGLSRTQFVTVKMMLGVIISIVSAIAVFLIALLFGLSQNAASFSFQKVENVFYFFIQALSYTSVALLFGLLFRRSGIAIGVFFLYLVVLENMLSAICNHYLDNTGYFFPLRASSSLIGFPFFRNVVKQLIKTPDSIYLLIVSFAYLAIWYFVSKRKFETDDL